jgi:D-aminoacyl-tRNA deacylase
MLAIVQRVLKAQVSIDSKVVGQINQGFVVLLGVIKGDNQTDLDYLVKKISNLRIMPDQDQKMNLNLKDSKGEVLVISQFTLAGDVSKGNRPSFINAADPKEGEKYYNLFVDQLKSLCLTTATGQFGAYMELTLTNDGPTTIIIDSNKINGLSRSKHRG